MEFQMIFSILLCKFWSSETSSTGVEEHTSFTLFAVVDRPATVHCKLSDASRARWMFECYGNNCPEKYLMKRVVVFNGHHLNEDLSGFTINTSVPGQYDLHSRRIRVTDAGTYSCEEVSRNIATVELVVVDDQPACTVDRRNVDSMRAFEDLQINCSVIYNGHRAPSIEWKFTDNRTSRIDHMGADVRTLDAGEQVTSLLNLTLHPSMNGSHFVCHPITGYQYPNDSFIESKRRFSASDDPFALCQTLMIISAAEDEHLYEQTDQSETGRETSVPQTHKRQQTSVNLMTLIWPLVFGLFLIISVMSIVIAYFVRKNKTLKAMLTQPVSPVAVPDNKETTTSFQQFYNEILESELIDMTSEKNFQNYTPLEECCDVEKPAIYSRIDTVYQNQADTSKDLMQTRIDGEFRQPSTTHVYMNVVQHKLTGTCVKK